MRCGKGVSGTYEMPITPQVLAFLSFRVSRYLSFLKAFLTGSAAFTAFVFVFGGYEVAIIIGVGLLVASVVVWLVYVGEADQYSSVRHGSRYYREIGMAEFEIESPNDDAILVGDRFFLDVHGNHFNLKVRRREFQHLSSAFSGKMLVADWVGGHHLLELRDVEGHVLFRADGYNPDRDGQRRRGRAGHRPGGELRI